MKVTIEDWSAVATWGEQPGRAQRRCDASQDRCHPARHANALASSFAPVWDLADPNDLCGICQNRFDGVCGSCKTPRGGDECPLLFGECSHVFHMHCILKWLEGDAKDLCPMCKRKWCEYGGRGDDDEDEVASNGRQRQQTDSMTSLISHTAAATASSYQADLAAKAEAEAATAAAAQAQAQAQQQQQQQ